MKIYKIAQLDTQSLANKYPKANGTSGSLTVLKDIPNTSSISSSLTDYYVVPEIRNIPMSEFYLTGKSYSIEEDNRITKLQEEIEMSKQIKPLIVVMDKEGLYILEGAHRADALYNLKEPFIPALLVIDLESFNESI